MHVDIHNHFMPRGLFEAMRRGRDWYGVTATKEAHGKPVIVVKGIPWAVPPEMDIWSSPKKRIQRCKEREDVDIQAISVRGSLVNYHLDAQTGATYCREINEELAELQKTYPASFVGLAMIPWQDTRAALKELEYASKNLGLRAISGSTSINGRNLDEAAFLPIFEDAAAAGLFIFCHTSQEVAGIERMTRYAFNNTIGLPVETTLAIMSIIFGGVLDKCPELKICFCQGGAYALYGIGRISNAYHTKVEAKTMQSPPEDYLGLLYYECLTHNGEALKFLIDHVSADHVLLGTDFPLGDGIVGGAVPWIEKMSFLSEKDKHKILGENATRLLGILRE